MESNKFALCVCLSPSLSAANNAFGEFGCYVCLCVSVRRWESMFTSGSANMCSRHSVWWHTGNFIILLRTYTRTTQYNSVCFLGENSSFRNLSMICNHWLLLSASNSSSIFSRPLNEEKNTHSRVKQLLHRFRLTFIAVLVAYSLSFTLFPLFGSSNMCVPAHIFNVLKQTHTHTNHPIYDRDLFVYMQLSGILIEFKCAELLKTVSQQD